MESAQWSIRGCYSGSPFWGLLTIMALAFGELFLRFYFYRSLDLNMEMFKYASEMSSRWTIPNSHLYTGPPSIGDIHGTANRDELLGLSGPREIGRQASGR